MILRVSTLIAESCLKNSDVVSGHAGIENEVKGVTVQEITDMDNGSVSLISSSVKPGDIILTSFNDIKDDHKKQADLVRLLNKCEVAAIILFYVGDVVKHVDSDLIDLCNEIDLPLICPDASSGISYQDVILLVMSSLNKYIDIDDKLTSELSKKMITFSKRERPVQQALDLIWEKLNCSVAVFDRKRKTIIKNGVDLEKLIDYFKSYAHTEDSNNEIRDPKDSKWLIRSVNKHQEVFWIGAYDAGGDRVKILRSLHLLEMILELWEEDFQKESETELIRAIIKQDRETVRKLASYQGHNLDSAVGYLTISMSEEMNSIVAFRERIAEMKAHDSIDYISGDYKGKVIYIILGIPGVSYSKYVLEEVINKDDLKIPYISCYVYGEQDLFSMLPLSTHNFAKLVAIWGIKKRISRSDVLLFSQYQTLIEGEGADMRTQCVAMIRRLEKYDEENGGNIKDTLVKCILIYDMDYKKMATDEYVHYNTITYRMKKAEEILHLDLRKARNIALMYGVAITDKLLKEQ